MQLRESGLNKYTMEETLRKIAPSLRYVKKAPIDSPLSNVNWAPGKDEKTLGIVNSMLTEIEAGGEQRVLAYANKFDKWPLNKSPLLSKEEIRRQTSVLSEKTKADIQYQHERVKQFAERQMRSLSEFETNVDGVLAGQKLIPVNTVGCYAPGGRFSHISSASMTVTTAKVAGVKNIIAASPPLRGTTEMHPATLYAMYVAGADYILVLGGVQAIASFAFGLFTGNRADMIVGPGNKFVAEAKRALFGRVGIDLFAGPTEIGIIADETADPYIVATDLVSQAEHGVGSPAWLISTSERLARQVAEITPKLCEELARDVPGNASPTSWKDYGEIVVVDTRKEAVAVSDVYCPEHLEVHAKDLNWWLHNLSNYGSLFLGEETCVTYGDKTSGPNHVLPTKGAAKYTGGLSVQKYLKVLTYQRMDKTDFKVGEAAARISRYEGMEGHARSWDVRGDKYFHGRKFDDARLKAKM